MENWAALTHGPCHGITEYAFTIHHTRNWLSRTDCDQIRLLLEKAKLDKLPDRMAHANWNLQHSAYQYFLRLELFIHCQFVPFGQLHRCFHISWLLLRQVLDLLMQAFARALIV
jgi:hypothetical protein